MPRCCSGTSGSPTSGLADATRSARECAKLPSVPALIIDAEDTFTAMLAAQLQSLGLAVEVRRFDEPYDMDRYDLIVLGPGPGDSADRRAPEDRSPSVGAGCRTGGTSAAARRMPESPSAQQPARPRTAPPAAAQPGSGAGVDLFGARERVGFYNTFAAFCDQDKIEVDGIGVVGGEPERRDRGGVRLAWPEFRVDAVPSGVGAHGRRTAPDRRFDPGVLDR